MKIRNTTIFCPIKDELFFIHKWIDYYSTFFEDIYILNLGSEKTYIDQFKTKVHIINHPANVLDALELHESILEVRNLLFNKGYKHVIPTDVDEFFWCKEGLNNYFSKLQTDKVTPVGYELIHLPEKEEEYNPKLKIFEQRNYWYRNNHFYGKPVIYPQTPYNHWSLGFHNLRGEDKYKYLDKDLLLIHLHKFDYGLYIKKHLEYSFKPWSKRSIEEGWNFHYRFKDLNYINKQYYNTHNNKIEPIPQNIKSLLNI